MVFYRKYRPQTINELDSTTVRETLTSILASPNLPHAFLFTGPKGLGKTSTARILAKVVNCQKRKEGSVEPCNTCDSCVSITNGSNIDVLEIDGASNRGIDEIRDLREKVKLSPSAATKKVYIIDEVHMLTTEAFNALLKTIEEPPSHVMFVFCTTEPQKVPATILSRCFHVAFSLATDEEIVRSLERIVKGEKLVVDKESLKILAGKADGSFRDGAKILEEVVLRAGKEKITPELIETFFHTANLSVATKDFLLSCKEKNAKKALEIIASLVKEGTDMAFFTQKLLSVLHHMLLAHVAIEKNSLGLDFSMDEIQLFAALLSEVYKEIKFSVVPQLPIEIFVVRVCENAPEQTDVKEIVAPSTKPTIASLKQKVQSLQVRAIIKGEKEPEPEKKTTEETVKQKDLHSHENGNPTLLENIIYKVKPYNHSVAGVLRGCSIRSIDDKEIIFETAYKFHKEKLNETKTLEILEKAIKEITGKTPKVLVELKK
ncbi:MAG: DNA polymerase III subunit gamma/tau [Candidatus Levyibacteriota bacterium]